MFAHYFLLAIAILMTIIFVCFSFFDNKNRKEYEKNGGFYVFCLAYIVLFWGGFAYGVGAKDGAYNQMRGEYKVTYKTITIIENGTETQKTDTIIHVFD